MKIRPILNFSHIFFENSLFSIENSRIFVKNTLVFQNETDFIKNDGNFFEKIWILGLTNAKRCAIL